MGRDSRQSPFPDACLASPAEVRGWVREEGECCTPETFRLDLASTPGSPWNRSAISIFVDDFIEVGAYACTDRKMITTMINRHFRTLKRQYNRLREEAEAARRGAKVDRTEALREHASDQRQYNRHQRRLRTALWYPETRKHGQLLKDLGPEGMSSDEGEYVGEILLHYRIRRKPWRAAWVTQLLRLLDALSRRNRSTQGQGSLQGSRPRLRYISEDTSSARAVPRLPRIAYDPVWLAEQRALQVRDLQIREEAYDISVSYNVQL
ncbi:hypothetical protein BC628DRAFT_1327195 [Trametes gibbosa]|nr:hypothetical protein BC628DRAFT_1327195 [Trametes gibbosa]